MTMEDKDKADELRMIGAMIVGLNYGLLRKQKLELLQLMDPKVDKLTKNVILSSGSLDGIVHLLDAIQDSVVSAGRKTEAEVFGKEGVDERGK